MLSEQGHAVNHALSRAVSVRESRRECAGVVIHECSELGALRVSGLLIAVLPSTGGGTRPGCIP